MLTANRVTSFALCAAACLFACGSGDGEGADAPDGAIDPDSGTIRDDAEATDFRWDEKARRVMDSAHLAAAFSDAQVELPGGAIIYVARITEGADSPGYQLFDYGPGAFDSDFWPASTIKVLAAIGALDRISALGVSGAAGVNLDGVGDLGTVRELISSSIEVSSNSAYTRTLQIAGYERINDEFLTADNGFPSLILERSYVSGMSVRSVGEITLTDGEQVATIPALDSQQDFGCDAFGDYGNCTNLFELTEGARRVLLDEEITAEERFAIDPVDLDTVRTAMCAAHSPFETGAQNAFGSARACNKTGWVALDGYHYLDHGLIERTDTGERFLMAAVVEWNADCSSHSSCVGLLEQIAEHSLTALGSAAPGVVLERDGGVEIAVQVDLDGTVEGVPRYQLTVAAEGADRIDLYLDATPLAATSEPGTVTTFEARHGGDPEVLITAQAFRDGTQIGHRSRRHLLPAAN